MFKRYKDMSDAELAKKRSFFKKFAAFDNKFCSPPIFLSFFGVSAAASFLLPGLPNLFLFCLCGAAGLVAGSRFISVTGKTAIDDEMNRRYPPAVQSEASAPATAAPAAVTQMPDLSEAFSRGVDNPNTMKPLRFKGPGQSSFLGG